MTGREIRRWVGGTAWKKAAGTGEDGRTHRRTMAHLAEGVEPDPDGEEPVFDSGEWGRRGGTRGRACRRFLSDKVKRIIIMLF
jgi:hypothetical protein